VKRPASEGGPYMNDHVVVGFMANGEMGRVFGLFWAARRKEHDVEGISETEASCARI
jgi:hypothetical protein